MANESKALVYYCHTLGRQPLPESVADYAHLLLLDFLPGKIWDKYRRQRIVEMDDILVDERKIAPETRVSGVIANDLARIVSVPRGANSYP